MVKALIADLAAGRTPAALSDAAKRQDARIPPPARQSTADLASRIKDVVHIATDTAPATLVLAEPIARVAHYKGVLDKGGVYFSFWITSGRRISRLSLYLD